jgi:hypothetical protein
MWDRGGQQAGLGCDWAYSCSIEVLGSAGKVAGERRWQSRGNTAVAAQSPVKQKARLGIVRRGKLQRDLGKVLGGLKGAWSERSSEFIAGYSAATIGTRAPASTEFDQGNKCACGL